MQNPYSIKKFCTDVTQQEHQQQQQQQQQQHYLQDYKSMQ
jgi:hypothetical protein